jgi:hypothetical protein
MRASCTVIAILGGMAGVTDRPEVIYRGRRVRRLLIGLGLYGVVGMFTLVKLAWPWDFIGGPVTDAIFAYCVFQAIRIWDDRLLHLEETGDGIPECPETAGVWRCAGMRGHLGPCLFGVDEEALTAA